MYQLTTSIDSSYSLRIDLIKMLVFKNIQINEQQNAPYIKKFRFTKYAL